MRSKAFFRSLLVTSTLSFATPVLLIGVLVVGLCLITQIPPFQMVSGMMTKQVLTFLTVFGSGSAFEGALVIGATCSLVGTLFDAYAYYNRLRNG